MNIIENTGYHKRNRPTADVKNDGLVANWETLQRIFIRPEDEHTRRALVKYMEQILFGLHDFIKIHVGITEEMPLKTLAERFMDSAIQRAPSRKLADVIRSIIEELAPHAVNVASPYFIGHMTSAIPYFMVHLQTIVAALHQNPVKLETSKVVSIQERQVLAKMHRLIFDRDDGFYKRHQQRPQSTLGSFVGDGTLANLTALWVARNRFFKPKGNFAGVEQDGLAAALRAYDLDRVVVLVSRMGHYSLRKAGGLLGIGNKCVVPMPVDAKWRMDTDALKRSLSKFRRQRIGVIAVAGIAGTTETGTIDPLEDLATICRNQGVHFHVDAAWGGPVLLSRRYRSLLSGIENADSVTVDGHKQLYMPMGCGMIYFRDPSAMDAVAYHAAYVNRPGSVDLGIRSLEGSRAATSLILGGALDIMGADGYAVLIDHGIETAKAFAAEIESRPLFEIISPPQLNILTYRLRPEGIQDKDAINRINRTVQQVQREAGRSFVSRTTLADTDGQENTVLRAVVMNPLTHPGILREILDEQEAIYRKHC